MDIAAARAFYFDYTAKLNDRIRTLAMSGIGIIWVFKQTIDTGTWMPNALFAPGFLLVAALGLDVFQQAYGAMTWGWLSRKSKNIAPTTQIHIPGWVNRPTAVMFYTKAFLVAAGYVLLLLYLKGRFSGAVA